MGNRCQKSMALILGALSSRSTLRANQAVSATATTPIRAFWVTLTIDAICSESSPAGAPAAETAAVVSMLPPIHTPATAGDSPNRSANQGRMEIEGNSKAMTIVAV